ncbi:putative Transcriptional regulatory protein, TetR family [Bradyrhizobium sp. ORS 278]|uniref:TetR/AcrR family transcriptional regulator n=1 Tax=Bradyrhizobium sp. (strain ORS 278) TaxID=114615 RepID=UPI0001507D47|nr:TetR/AcrR family transcriptional regulator [Bradyrhizobium sp. ORS 278]CAL75764.1 putative Transcriptional regulatory protein, TetR family [Bradyrhizobium sp. ORS 278]
MDTALGKALVVFSERGYHAASLAELRAAMKLATGSLYKAFADKRAIFLATLDYYIARRDRQLRERLDAQASGRSKLEALLQFYAESASDSEGRRGCLVVTSATELATLDAEAAAKVRAALRRVETLLRDLLRLGQADGSIRKELDPDAVAGALFCIIQGLRVVGKTGRPKSEMTSISKQAASMFT